MKSTARPEALFPEGHPLQILHRASFDAVRRALAGLHLSAIWIDAEQDPGREGFRQSYNKLHGVGSSNMMPFIAAWLSTGSTGPASNVVVLPHTIDRSIIAYGQRVGLLGEYVFIDNFREMLPLARATGKKIYSVDDLGEEFEGYTVVSSALSQWLNSKDDLHHVSAYAPSEVVKDMYEITLDDYHHAARNGGRVFLKTCNTESAGAGVYIARDPDEFVDHLAGIRARQAQYALRRVVVIQPEISGHNRSFQLFLDPRNKQCVQVVALTDQIVEADGKTYKSSINHPITTERVAVIGPMLVDMVERVWKRFPDAFGFLMCDYFQTPQGPVIFDPGIRPTGNTATAMVFHLARKLTGRDHFVSLIKVPTNIPGLTFDKFAASLGTLTDPENIVREGLAALPWGWNHDQGFGMIIGVAPDETAFHTLENRIANTRFG